MCAARSESINHGAMCASLKSCASCASTTLGCAWCDGKCQWGACVSSADAANAAETDGDWVVASVDGDAASASAAATATGAEKTGTGTVLISVWDFPGILRLESLGCSKCNIHSRCAL